MTIEASQPVHSKTNPAEPVARNRHIPACFLLFILTALPTFGSDLITFMDLGLIFLLPVTLLYTRGDVYAFRLLILLGVWMLAQVVSDITNGEFPAHIGGAVLEPLLIIGAFSATVTLMKHRPQSWLAIARTLLLANVAYYLGFVNQELSAEAWKYGLGIPVSLLVLSYLGPLWARGRVSPVILVMLSLSALSLFLGFRNLALEMGVGAALLFTQRPSRRAREAHVARRQSGVVVGVRVAIVLVVLAIGSSLYGELARSGRLQGEQAVRYATANGQVAILAARPEIFGSAAAIVESPLFGLGSQGGFDRQVVDRAFSLAAAGNITLTLNEQRRIFTPNNGLNTHSLLFSAWTKGGPFSALALAVILGRCLIAALGRITLPANLQPLVVGWAVVTIWDLLFSPWSPHYHLGLGVLVGLISVGLTNARGSDRSYNSS